jgi:hypothetical protein
LSTLIDGTEDLVSQNLTPAAAYAVVNTTFQKSAQMRIADKDINFYGLVRDGQQRGSHQFAVERNIVAVEIRAEGDAPASNSFTCQIVVNGVTQSQVFSLAAGQTYAFIAASPVIDVPANTVAYVAVVNGNQATDVVVTLKTQLMIL